MSGDYFQSNLSAVQLSAGGGRVGVVTDVMGSRVAPTWPVSLGNWLGEPRFNMLVRGFRVWSRKRWSYECHGYSIFSHQRTPGLFCHQLNSTRVAQDGFCCESSPHWIARIWDVEFPSTKKHVIHVHLIISHFKHTSNTLSGHGGICSGTSDPGFGPCQLGGNHQSGRDAATRPKNLKTPIPSQMPIFCDEIRIYLHITYTTVIYSTRL